MPNFKTRGLLGFAYTNFNIIWNRFAILPLSSIRLWLRSMVFKAGLLFEITATASLWRKSDLWNENKLYEIHG